MALTRIGNGFGGPRTQQEKTVLKKAGIVVATAAAGLLAVSPLAFAGESGKDWGGKGSTNIASSEQNTEGLINVTDTNVNAPINALNCLDLDPVGLVPVGAEQVVTPLAGALALFGQADVAQNTRVSNDCANSQGASNAGESFNQD